MDDTRESSDGIGLMPCPTCGSAPGAPVLTDWDGNEYSHALPMQLLGSIDVSLARRTDGSGHAVVEPASGMPLVTGQTAQGTWDAAEDIARQLGRRRVQAVIDGNLSAVGQGIAEGEGLGTESGSNSFLERTDNPAVRSVPPEAAALDENAIEDFATLRRRGLSVADATTAVQPYDEGAADMSPSVIAAGGSAISDYLLLRKKGWSDADASEAVLTGEQDIDRPVSATAKGSQVFYTYGGALRRDTEFAGQQSGKYD